MNTEWLAIGLTVIAMCGGALMALVSLVVKVGKVVSSLDNLGEKVEDLAKEVKEWQNRHNSHAERIASLEARTCPCGNGRCNGD